MAKGKTLLPIHIAAEMLCERYVPNSLPDFILEVWGITEQKLGSALYEARRQEMVRENLKNRKAELIKKILFGVDTGQLPRRDPGDTLPAFTASHKARDTDWIRVDELDGWLAMHGSAWRLEGSDQPLDAQGEQESFAEYFDPVTPAQLEAMFPAHGKWGNWTRRASRNGLKPARTARGLFNPYQAAEWFLLQGEARWDRARCMRVLASNLPDRSQHIAEMLRPTNI